MGDTIINRIIAVCGVKNSGKTTLLEKLVAILTERGLKVAVIKHDGHDFFCDIPGTDSWRMAKAGAYGTAVFSDTQIFVHKCGTGEQEYQLAELFPEADVIFIEGMKDSRYPKIEVIRREISRTPVSEAQGRFLIVTDWEDGTFPEKTLGLNAAEEIAERIRQELGRRKREEEKEPVTERRHRISAVILCGGSSTRMGTDKAMLMAGEKTFLARIAANLQGAEEIMLSVRRQGAYPGAAFIEVPDQFPGCGPIAGIQAALAACNCPVLFVAGCDMPFADFELAEELAEYLEDGVDAVIAIDDAGRRQALCGLYRKKTEPVFREQLAAGDYKLDHLVNRLQVRCVAFERLHGSPEKFVNINTPEEYQQLKEREEMA